MQRACRTGRAEKAVVSPGENFPNGDAPEDAGQEKSHGDGRKDSEIGAPRNASEFPVASKYASLWALQFNLWMDWVR